ncbi:conjugal transfer protein TraG N-terminal domain-containing protein, partial [Pseudomonas aeruginosa]
LMFVMGTMFLVLPAFWMTALTWAGLHAGAIAQALINGTKDAQTAGSKGGGALIKAGGRK